MKILHTADWHLGQALHGFDRRREQADFLGQIATIVGEEQPDAMLISGDVFNHSNPSAATLKLYVDSMLAIHQACPTMSIIVTAGNHDSPSRLSADGELWKYFKVHVIGRVETTDGKVNAESHLVEVKDKEGKALGLVVAVPYIHSQNIPDTDGPSTGDTRMKRFFQSLLDKAIAQSSSSVPIVLMAHLAVSGSDRAGHDKSLLNMEFYPLDMLGQGYDYLSLGHLHRPQEVPGSGGRARYAGTPVAVSFNEDYPHSVAIVDVERGQAPVTRLREITNPIPLITLPHAPRPFEEALLALAGFPDKEEAYIRLNVLVDDYPPADSMERASHATEGKACKLCLLKATRREADPTDKEDSQLTLQDVRELSPLEIAEHYYREVENREMDDDLREMLNEVIKEVEAKQRSET